MPSSLAARLHFEAARRMIGLVGLVMLTTVVATVLSRQGKTIDPRGPGSQAASAEIGERTGASPAKAG